MVRLPLGTPDRIEWTRFLRIAAPLAGLVAVLTIYAAPVWLVLFPGSIFLAVHVYRRRQPGPLKTTQGLKMGILIGLLTYTVLALYVAGVVVRDPAGYRLETENGMKDAAAHNPNPQAAEVAQFFSGAKGVALFTVMAMALLLVFTLIIGGVSGALAASLARNKPGP